MEDPDRLEPDLYINESLKLVRKLGAGAMGVVWLADHLTLRKRVAVKFMHPQLASDPAALGRFVREAFAMNKLAGNYVPKVYDCVTSSDGAPYIVMEALEGATLEDRIQKNGRLSVRETALIFEQVARAVTAVHKVGIVHRDLKPENILVADVRGTLQIKLLDFGVSRGWTDDTARVTSTGTALGTANYMSPEQILDPQNVDHRADLWAMAGVVYECLTGDLPFKGETYGAICIAVTKAHYIPPTQLIPELSAGIDAWFARAFHPNLERRFQSAAEMEEAFEASLSDPSSVAHSIRPDIPRRRSGLLIALAAGMVAIAAAWVTTRPPVITPSLALDAPIAPVAPGQGDTIAYSALAKLEASAPPALGDVSGFAGTDQSSEWNDDDNDISGDDGLGPTE